MSEPIFPDSVWISKPWSGRRLSTIRGVQIQPGNPLGICREICAYKGSENPVTRGKYAGMNLKQIIDTYPEITGEDTRGQLLRVAYMDTVHPLSIQVHPDADLAVQEDDYEKSEAWYVVDCDPDAWLYAGTKTTDKEVLRNAARNGSLMDYMKKVSVKPGDFITVPAGLIHACGANMLVIEAGTFGGITYRLWDYGSTRPLDVEKGFDAVHTELSCELRRIPLTKRSENKVSPGVVHPLFRSDVVDIAQTWTCKTQGLYRILSVVDSSCTLCVDGVDYPMKFTQTALIPADTEKFTVKGNCRVLISYMPLP